MIHVQHDVGICMHAITSPPSAGVRIYLMFQLCLSGDRIAAKRRAYQAKSFEYYVDCTYVELFNESCTDLLRPGTTPSHGSVFVCVGHVP